MAVASFFASLFYSVKGFTGYVVLHEVNNAMISNSAVFFAIGLFISFVILRDRREKDI